MININKLPNTQTYNQYLEDINYKQQLNLFSRTNRSIDMYYSRQWRDKTNDDMPKPIANIIKPLIDTKCALIRESPASVVVSSEDTDMGSNENSEVSRREIAELWTSLISKTQERLQWDKTNVDGIIQASITGQYILYTYWDSSITTRNGVKGDICIKSIPLTNVHYADQFNNDIQSQEWVMISYRDTVNNVKKMAEGYGVDPELVQADSSNNYEANEQYVTLNDPNRCTVIIKFTKVNDKVQYTICTRTAELKTVKTSLKLYPLSVFNYQPELNSAYALGDVEQCINNQLFINRAYAFVLSNAQKTGMPILLVKKGTTNRITNKTGQIIQVNNMDDMRYLMPPSMSYDVKIYIESLKSDTKDMLGLNDIILGRNKIDNTSAFLAVRQTSLTALDNYRQRYYTFLEDTCRIWIDYYTSYYNTPRLTTIEIDGKNTLIEVKGDEYKDIIYNVKIDVGTSGLYSELTDAQNLFTLFDKGLITEEEYLEFLPSNFISRKTELVETVKKRLEQAKQSQTTQQITDEEIKALSPEQQAMLQNNPNALDNIANSVEMPTESN